MRSLTIEHIEKFIDSQGDSFQSPNLVETGTYEGKTVFNLYEYFQKIYTIELNQRAHDFCVNKSRNLGVDNIRFYNGQSQDILPEIIDELNENLENCIFFLDAHVTENGSNLTSRGDVDVPICLELKVISDNFKSKCMVIIDDTRILGKESSRETAYADWSSITHDNIIKSLGDRKFTWSYFDGDKDPNDRMVIMLDSIN